MRYLLGTLKSFCYSCTSSHTILRSTKFSGVQCAMPGKNRWHPYREQSYLFPGFKLGEESQVSSFLQFPHLSEVLIVGHSTLQEGMGTGLSHQGSVLSSLPVPPSLCGCFWKAVWMLQSREAEQAFISGVLYTF